MVFSSLTELTPDYMHTLPLDPIAGDTSDGYRYARGSSQIRYTLMFKLETDDHDSWCGISPGGSNSIGWSDAAWYRKSTHPDCQF